MGMWQERLTLIVEHKLPRPTLVDILRMPDLKSWEPGRVDVEFDPHSDFYSIGDTLFGGYIAALADTYACHALATVLTDDLFMRTRAIQLFFHRPIRNEAVHIVGRLVQDGKRTAHSRVEFTHNDGELCVHAEASIAKVRLPDGAKTAALNANVKGAQSNKDKVND